MNVVVCKFGGNLLKDEINRKQVIAKVQKLIQNGSRVIVVVSAFGRKGDPYATDTFLSYTKHLAKKEKDRLVGQGEIIASLILANQFLEAGISTYPLKEHEIGILTNNSFGDGQVMSLNAVKMMKQLRNHDVLIVPGFVGVNKNGDLVTLGRGGSDLTAVLVAYMLSAQKVLVYKDVDGVFSADPSDVNQPMKHDAISYHQMQLLSRYGATILQENAVKYALKYEIELQVVPFYNDGVGTLIANHPCLEKYIAMFLHKNEVFIITSSEDYQEVKNFLKEQNMEYQLSKVEDVIKILFTKELSKEEFNAFHRVLFVTQ